MSDGGGRHKVYGPYWDNANSTMYLSVYVYAFETGGTYTTPKNFWTNEDKTSVVTSRQGDITGTVDGYFDDTLYDIEIRALDNTTIIKQYTNVRFTGDAHILSNATAYPSVTALNNYQLAVKRTAGDVIQELGITDGTAFRRIGGLNDVVAKTSAHTATLNEGTILCDATSAAFTVDLPTAAGIKGKSFLIKKTDSSSNAITIDGASAETIDGVATLLLYLQYDSVLIRSDGVNWVVESRTSPVPAFSVGKTSQTNITGVDVVAWDVTDFDTHSQMGATTFTVVVPGIYQFNISLDWDLVVDQDTLTVLLYEGGVGPGIRQVSMSAAHILESQDVSWLINAAVGETYSVNVVNANRDTSTIGAFSYFSGFKVN